MSRLKTYSPLRYPGGKNALTKYVQRLISTNDLLGCTYIEPYAGGAAVALSLLMDGHVNRIVINDFDRSIYAFWHSVLYRTDDLCRLIENCEITMDNWYLQKEIQRNKNNTNLLDLGFSTLFLNRTNRSGIIKAGVIGGLEQQGNYKMDCRFRKHDIINKIRNIANYKDQIDLYNLDTIDLINNVIANINEPSFIFFDPPYYKKGSQLYVNFYKHEDHVLLSNRISELENVNWIVTYDNVPEINNMYNEFNSLTYGLRYTAGKKYIGYEIMIFSRNTTITPECAEVV